MKRTAFLLFSGLGILLSFLAPGSSAQSIKPGTEIKVRLLSKLDTAEAKEGQFFSATLAESVSLDNKKVLTRGTRVNGLVTETVRSGRLKRSASITLILTSVDKTPIHTRALQIDGKSHVVRNTAPIGGGNSAATGAVPDAGTSYVTAKQEIVLPSETELDFVIADRPSAAIRTPEPVVERNIDRAPEPKLAILHDDSREQSDDAYDALIFSDRDKWLIHSFFQSNYGNLPPALAKRGGDLPPALEKRLRREETLPSDLQDQAVPLPGELERQLPSLPRGYSRVVLLGRVMILQSDGQIVDLMFTYR
jgi:hypothetical protein